MGKNKYRKTTKNISTQNPVNQPSIRMEIDYDKLAEAIVKANNTSSDEKYKKSNFRLKVLNFINGAIYLSGYSYCVVKIINLWSGSLYDFMTRVVYTIICFIIALILFLMQQESLDESKDEILFHFNSNITVIVLLITILEFRLSK